MYDHKQVEPKWQKLWQADQTYRTVSDERPKFYALDMFPYPSGSGLHAGHVKGYTATDVMARYKRMTGHAVIHPMGWDAFGLPAEQYALKTNNHPSDFTKKNIQVFKEQLLRLGFSFDWDLEVDTTDPNYYKTTQWIFAQMLKKGLAELKDVEVNWCQELGTVLANEEVLDGPNGEKISEVGGFLVTKRAMRQWVLHITKYARRLVDDLDDIAWPESLKNIQRKWIYTTNDDGSVTLHLKDWLFSRQRYWGEPFPVAFDSKTGDIMVIEQLPVILPALKEFKPSGTGESPLGLAKEWLAEIPGHRRETNTMPQWAGSCWYYMGYLLKNRDGTYEPIQSEEAKERFAKYLPVDLYIGGQEHAVLHLLYARFWHKFLYDIGVLPAGKRYLEPFYKTINVGVILGPNGQKMSKSKGNVVNPDEIIARYGADTLRLYEMFMAPLTASVPWGEDGLEGMSRWVHRVWRLYEDGHRLFSDEGNPQVEKAFARCISEIERQMDSDAFNTPISSMMVFINECYKHQSLPRRLMAGFLRPLSMYAPHLADELDEQMGGTGYVFKSPWPKYDASLLVEDSISVAVQVNGRLRAVVSASRDASDEQITALARAEPSVQTAIGTHSIVKTVVVSGKLVNFVVQ